jgi:tRNA 2-thiocytidine biosynthesis protein TtcA
MLIKITVKRRIYMLQKLLSRTRKAIADYDMIREGDKIAVGVSGGKDSLALLCCMKALQGFYPNKFDLVALTLQIGLPGFKPDVLRTFYSNLGVEYHIEETPISKIVFEVRNEKNPCSLCSNMKRGAMYNAAKRLGCNKVAFAHHKDDVIETLLLSLFYEGRIHTFSPVTYLDRMDITLIRPFIYIEEKMISSFIRSSDIKTCSGVCKADGLTKRHYIKDVLFSLAKENRHIRDNIFGAIQRSRINGWHPPL